MALPLLCGLDICLEWLMSTGTVPKMAMPCDKGGAGLVWPLPDELGNGLFGPYLLDPVHEGTYNSEGAERKGCLSSKVIGTFP